MRALFIKRNKIGIGMVWIFFGFGLFASAITTNKALLAYVSPSFFTALRMLTAGAILLGYHLLRKSNNLTKEQIKKDLPVILAIALFTTFLNSVLKAYGLKYMVSSKAALIGSMDPFITALYAYFLWNEKLTKNKAIGILVGISGILVLLTTTSSLEDIRTWWTIFSYPELAALAAICISRYGWILAQKLLKSRRYKPSELNGLTMISGGIYALLYCVYNHATGFEVAPDMRFFELFAYTIVIGNIIAYTFYGSLLKKYSSTFVSLAGCSIPFFVQLYGPIVLGEKLSPIFFISFALVVTGMIIFYRDEIKTKGIYAQPKL